MSIQYNTTIQFNIETFQNTIGNMRGIRITKSTTASHSQRQSLFQYWMVFPSVSSSFFFRSAASRSIRSCWLLRISWLRDWIFSMNLGSARCRPGSMNCSWASIAFSRFSFHEDSLACSSMAIRRASSGDIFWFGSRSLHSFGFPPSMISNNTNPATVEPQSIPTVMDPGCVWAYRKKALWALLIPLAIMVVVLLLWKERRKSRKVGRKQSVIVVLSPWLEQFFHYVFHTGLKVGLNILLRYDFLVQNNRFWLRVRTVRLLSQAALEVKTIAKTNI